MDQFRTPLQPLKSNSPLGLKDSIITLGSCFSDAIGSRLKDFKFRALANPFGAIYNPVSLHKLLDLSLLQPGEPLSGFVQHNDIHMNFDFHASFSTLHQAELEEKLRETLASTGTFLRSAKRLMITYGTAWVFEHVESGKIVANCHKLPAALFTKRLLTVEEIVKSFESLYVSLKTINPDLSFILTTSPVRHLKDTLPLNSVSKSVVRMACHSLTQKFVDVEYFPAYEIMLDDLRDYRFYKIDMIHPTEQAEDYIWNFFIAMYMDDSTKKFIQEWQSIRTALNHKPFHVQSVGHQNFLRQTIYKLEHLKHDIDVSTEIATLQAQLKF